MRVNFLPSKSPEYRVLRAQSKTWALVWELGHGIFWVCVLSMPGVIAAWWASRDGLELDRNPIWSLIAPVVVLAVIGAVLKRYAIRKGKASNALIG